jgi:hypothetical protein
MAQRALTVASQLVRNSKLSQSGEWEIAAVAVFLTPKRPGLHSCPQPPVTTYEMDEPTPSGRIQLRKVSGT